MDGNETRGEPELNEGARPTSADALADEFLERHRRGERPEVSEYVERFPDLAEEIRELFPAMLMMEQIGSDGETAPTSRTAASEAPRRIGDYRILGELGRGGMGMVYEAVQESLGRRVALKVLPASAFLSDASRQRFQREAQAAGRLHHPNVVPVFEVGEEAGVHFYAMQLIRGQSLEKVIAELRELRRHGGSGRLAGDSSSTVLTGEEKESGSPEQQYFRRVARLGAQVAAALAHAHAEGILHRDVKPANLLLDAQGRVWITDFGLAKAVDSEGLTRAGEVVGTLAYMAPERFAGWCDPRSDIYGLGVTLYELLTLRRPFETVDQHVLVKKVTTEEPPTPRRIAPSIPRDLETVIFKAISREPGERYKRAGELAEDLERFLSGEPVAARRTGVWERGVKWARRRPAQAALVVVSFAALLIITVVSLWYSARLRVAVDTAQERLDEFDRVSASVDLEELKAAAERLWPASSAKVDELTRWLDSAGELLAKRAALEKALRKLRDERALPYSDGQREQDRKVHLETKGYAQLLEQRDAAQKTLEELKAAGHDPEAATALGVGSDPGRKRPTYYFRRTFEVVDPKALKVPLMHIEFSDGVVAYLNGQEVLRENLEPLIAMAKRYVELDASLLSVGSNLLAVELPSGPRSDLMFGFPTTFDLTLSVENGEPLELIGKASRWRYQDTGENLGTAWREVGFDDSAWREGVAPFASRFGGGAGKAAEAKRTVERLDEQIRAFEAEEPVRRTWEFADTTDRWWHATLVRLVEGLESFAAVTIPDVEKRMDFASTVREKTVEGVGVAARWREAIARVRASERYGDELKQKLTPQEGLIPLGPDTRSGLEEFAHLQTGKPAVRGDAGELELAEETGMVFVLIPAGTFLMGAEGQLQLGVRVSESEDGLLVTRVVVPSVAARLGIEVGDVLMEVNGEVVGTGKEQLDTAARLGVDVGDVRVEVDGVARRHKEFLRAPPTELKPGELVSVELLRGCETKTLSGKPEWNVDPQTRLDEWPVHQVALDAFFLAKHEMTQGQWKRFTGANPSLYGPGLEFGGKTVDWRHPVEQVSWTECERELSRLDLLLPTEAQWEYAARAGTFTPWWMGTDPAELQEVGNVCDKAAKTEMPGDLDTHEWDDGYASHAPVGTYRSNAFGLHDVCGNVFEWCRDRFGSYTHDRVRNGDGERLVRSYGPRDRVCRGGCFKSSDVFARSAYRLRLAPGFRGDFIGVRPARIIHP